MALVSAAPFKVASASGDLEKIIFKAGHPRNGEALAQALSEPTSEQFEILEANADVLRRTPGITVEIGGFADSHECSKSGCYYLSLRRARVVYEWLVVHGVPVSKLKGPTANGSDWPIDRTGKEEGSQYNRRVQFDSVSPDR
jgi:outer membrane protein OmpA-like peptidoglycan-associated protein